MSGTPGVQPPLNQEQIPKLRVKASRFYYYMYYYDPGSDMYHEEVWLVEISRNGVNARPLMTEERRNVSYRELKEGTEQLNRLFLEVNEVFAKPIANKVCPVCGRQMKVVQSYRRRKPNEAVLIRRSYPDMKLYDEEEGYWFTCFRCGVRCEAHFRDIDGGSVLYWRFVIERSGLRAELDKAGITNDRNLFDANIKFLDGLIKMGLVEVVDA